MVSTFSRPRESFQQLIEVQTLPSESISPRSKLTSFKADLRETACMYKDFWGELSTKLPNISAVSQKAQDLCTQVQQVRQQWDHIGPEFEPQSEAATTYAYFRLNVLYDDKERDEEEHKSIASNEDDGTAISKVLKSLYEEKIGRDCNVPLRFNGREDFTEFLGDKNVPNRVARKGERVTINALLPAVFMLLFIAFTLGLKGVHFEGPFDTYETQFQRNLAILDIYSEMNDVFESKAGILNTSIDDIKSSIHQKLNLLESLENKIELPVIQKSRLANSNITTPLWTPEMTKNTTELMFQKAKAFAQVQSDKFTTEDPNYLFWANNMQSEYYQGLLNWNVLSFRQLEEDSEVMPFTTLFGILQFFFAFVIIFVNFLIIYELISLGNDAMNIYLSISQPELDALKAKYQSFIDYLDAKKDLDENSNLDIENKPLLVRPNQAAIQQRVRIKPLKQYRRSRTELESRLGCTIMLLIGVSFLFMAPIAFRREYKDLIDQQMDGFSNITDLETSFSFSYNTLKQQLTKETSVSGSKNAANSLKTYNDKLLQNLQSIAFNTDHNVDYKGYDNLFKDFMTGSFCQKLIGEVRERCASFEESENVVPHMIASLQQMTDEYEKLLDSKDGSSEKSGSAQLLTKMEKLNLNSFREDFLRTGLQILRDAYPKMILETYNDAFRLILLYGVGIYLLWVALIYMSYLKIIKPLYQLIGQRKKLIRLIPFPLLMNMKDEVIEYIWKYCEVPTHETQNQNTNSV